MASLFVTLLTFGAAVAAWSGLGWLLLNVSPARPLAVVVAYVFGFVGLTCTTCLIAWVARRPRSEEGRLKSPAGYVGHAMWLAVIILFAL